MLFEHWHVCVSKKIVKCSRAECPRCNPKARPFRFLLAFLGLSLAGCGDFSLGQKAKQGNAGTSTVTFVYTYNKDGKPIEAAKVKDNVKLDVQVKDATTGEYLDTQMDVGGWLLVKPESPIQRLKNE